MSSSLRSGPHQSGLKSNRFDEGLFPRVQCAKTKSQFLIRNPHHNCQQMIQTKQCCLINRTDNRAAFLAGVSYYFINHDLRGQLQSVFGRRFQRWPKQRIISDRAVEKNNQIAALHVPGHSKAAAIKSNAPCRAASAANSGRLVSGTQMRKSFIPLRLFARRYR